MVKPPGSRCDGRQRRKRFALKIVILFCLIILTSLYGYSAEADNHMMNLQKEVKNKTIEDGNQDTQKQMKGELVEPSTPTQDSKQTEATHTPVEKKNVIPTSLPKYTIMQIKEMKARGIDPEALDKKETPSPGEAPSDAEVDKKTEELADSGKVIFRTAESACGHLRFNQICEYRKRNNSRWIGNCVYRANSQQLYCK